MEDYLRAKPGPEGNGHVARAVRPRSGSEPSVLALFLSVIVGGNRLRRGIDEFDLASDLGHIAKGRGNSARHLVVVERHLQVELVRPMGARSDLFQRGLERSIFSGVALGDRFTTVMLAIDADFASASVQPLIGFTGCAQAPTLAAASAASSCASSRRPS